jgi:hypothetical protein
MARRRRILVVTGKRRESLTRKVHAPNAGLGWLDGNHAFAHATIGGRRPQVVLRLHILP